MHHLRGVLFFVLTLLVALALAAEGRGKREFGSISSDVHGDSSAQVASSRGLDSASKASEGVVNTSTYEPDAGEGLQHDDSIQDSISQRSDSASHSLQENGASVTQDDIQLSRESAEELAKKSSLGLEVTLVFWDTDDNATVSSAICAKMNASVTKATLTSYGGFFQLPACLTAAPLTNLLVTGMATSSWSVFPTTLESFTCRNCRFRYDSSDASTPISTTPAAHAVDGFNEDGTLNWDEIFTNWPVLVNIDFSQSYFKAQLPTALPAAFTSLRLNSVFYDDINDPEDGLFGEIPSTLLSNIGPASTASTSIVLDLSNTRINGTIPPTLFSTFAGRAVSDMSITLAATSIQSTIPPTLFQGLSSANMIAFVFSLQNNRGLTGALPTALVPSGLLRTLGCSFSLYLGFCGLSGPIPNGFLSGVPSATTLNVDLGYNQIGGPLPAYIFNADEAPQSMQLNLGNNAIDGELTAFLSASWTNNHTISNVNILLNDNQLTGEIPGVLLFNYYENKKRELGDESDIEGQSHQNTESSSSSRSASKRFERASSAAVPVGLMTTGSFTFSLANNGLTGSVPSDLLHFSFDPAMTGAISVDLSNNFLEDTFPSDFFATVPDSMTQTTTFAASNNTFTGPVPAFCSSATSSYIFTMALNKLSGSIPTSWESCKISEMTLDENPQLSGSIPPNLFTATGLYRFSAKNTGLTGVIPTLSASLSVLDLSATHVDFCDPASVSAMSGYSRTCTVEETVACTCSAAYAQCGGADITCPPPVEPQAPFVFAPPTAANTPPTLNTPSNPPTTLSPGGCPLVTSPGPEFYCFDGRWYAPSVTKPTLTIPSGAGKVVILGDLHSSELVFRDLNSNVDVDGCANNLTTVMLDLTKAQIEQIGTGKINRTLITTAGSNCNSLNSVNLNTHVADEGCKKLKSAKQVTPDGRTLNAAFSLQTSSCNNWWIILVAVMCSVVFIAVIVTVILVACCDFFKLKARPFAGSEGHFMM